MNSFSYYNNLDANFNKLMNARYIISCHYWCRRMQIWIKPIAVLRMVASTAFAAYSSMAIYWHSNKIFFRKKIILLFSNYALIWPKVTVIVTKTKKYCSFTLSIYQIITVS